MTAFPLLPAKYRDVIRLTRLLSRSPERRWVAAGERRALRLFHAMARRVPAYSDFLKKRKVNAARVRTIADFREVPPVDKQNYLRQYPHEKLCWDGTFAGKQWVISTTSGSTGEPFYFPREDVQDKQYAGTAELYLRANFAIHRRSTLYIDAFPMGAWIGGLFTYEAVRQVAERGKYPLSVITPGIDKQEIINAVKKIGPKFDQVIIGCYGPFLKDALDDGVRQGVRWKNYNLKFVFSAEGFSEEFRDYVVRVAGLKNPCRDTLNHYGSVDLGTMSYETPLAIAIRRLAVKDDMLYRTLFSAEHKLPTLTQYDPELFFFEEVNGGLLCSAASGLPLVRYDLRDNGGVIGYEEMRARLAGAGYDLGREARRARIADTVWRLPFVYVYERSDLSVSLYAFQIYPETVRKAIQKRRFEKDMSGKFSMLVRFDKRQDQYLEVNVELKAGRKPAKRLAAELADAVVQRLRAENSEYRKTYSEIPHRVRPRIVFWPYEHPLHFKPGTKQKWAKKG
jgi:phenylacetate-CoA ligase